jgi:hypothetical protein
MLQQFGVAVASIRAILSPFFAAVARIMVLLLQPLSISPMPQ